MTQGIGGCGSGNWNRWRDEADTSSGAQKAGVNDADQSRRIRR